MIRDQIVYSRLAAITRELSETVGRTARSRGLTERRRFAVAALTGAPGVAIQFQNDPGHSYLIRDSAAALLDYFAFELADGDIVVVGDPYSGGSTPQVLTFAAPVFHDGELVVFPAVRAELADLAGEFPGTIHPRATETWQEAIRVTPAKLYRNGVLQRDILRFLLRNSRAADLVRSDIEAIVGALRLAGDTYLKLLRDRGRGAVEAAIAGGSRRSALAMQRHLAGRAGLDRKLSASIRRPDAPDLAIEARILIGTESLRVDFAGSSPQVDCPYNMTLAHARGYGLAAAGAELLDDVAVNDGLLDSFEVTAPEGSLLNPRLPAATGLSDLVTGHVVGALVRRAFFDDRPGSRLDGPQPSLVLFRPIGSVEDNPPFALDPGYALSAQGWGPPVLAGSRLIPSAEILEARDGFVMINREFDAEGAITALVENRRGPLQANAVSPADGPGRPLGLTLIRDGAEQDLDQAAGLDVPPGARIRFVYPSYAGSKHG